MQTILAIEQHSATNLSSIDHLIHELQPLSPQAFLIMRAAEAAGFTLASYLHRLSCDDLRSIASNTERLHGIALAGFAVIGKSPETEYLAGREAFTNGALNKMLTAVHKSKHVSNLSQKTGSAVVPLVVPFLYSELVGVTALVLAEVSPELARRLVQQTG